MSNLFFTGTQEHALLVSVIREAQRSPKVPYFGRTALQKVVYFLKSLGVPTRYQFEIYHYGPFCDQIGTDIELLTADGLVVDRPEQSGAHYSNYGLASDGPLEELLSPHKDFLRKHAPIIHKVVDWLGGLKPRELELFATLHYAYRYELAGPERPDRDLVLARVRSYKGNKFAPPELNAAYDKMVSMGLIKP